MGQSSLCLKCSAWVQRLKRWDKPKSYVAVMLSSSAGGRGVHRMYGARAYTLLSPLTSDLLKGGVGASGVIWGQHISCWWVRVLFINVWKGMWVCRGSKPQPIYTHTFYLKGITKPDKKKTFFSLCSFNCGVPQGSDFDLFLLLINKSLIF